jgi:hypothetical protein
MKQITNITRDKTIYEIPLTEFLDGKWLETVRELTKTNNIIDIKYANDKLEIQKVKFKGY